jgi:hypothetical protein
MRTWLTVAVLLLAACDLNGNTTYPGASVFEAPDRGFHFHYLSPPWRTSSTASPFIVHLVIDEVGQRDTTTYKLFVGYYQGTGATPQAAASGLRAAAAAATPAWTITLEPKSVTTRTGEQGWEYHGYRDFAGADRFYQRETVFSDASGRLVFFSLSTVYPTTESDVDDLILSYSAAPDDGTETPARKPDAGAGLTDFGGVDTKTEGGAP